MQLNLVIYVVFIFLCILFIWNFVRFFRSVLTFDALLLIFISVNWLAVKVTSAMI